MIRGQTIGVLLFIAMLSVLAADVSIGCGNEYVYGPVDQKFTANSDEGAGYSRILVNQKPYEVPQTFWNQVEVGDTVKFNGKTWSIVKKGTRPTFGTPPSTTP